LTVQEHFNINPKIASFKIVFGNATIDIFEATTNKSILSFPDVFRTTETNNQ